MERATALELRQSLGKILARLQRHGMPILIEKGRKPAAVLISLDAYRKRFVDREADEARRRIVADIAAAKLTLPGGDAVSAVRQLRGRAGER